MMDARRMQELTMEWQGVALEVAAAERLAELSRSLRQTLDAVAGGSLFDTEPAHFDRALAGMADRSDD